MSFLSPKEPTTEKSAFSFDNLQTEINNVGDDKVQNKTKKLQVDIRREASIMEIRREATMMTGLDSFNSLPNSPIGMPKTPELSVFVETPESKPGLCSPGAMMMSPKPTKKRNFISGRLATSICKGSVSEVRILERTLERTCMILQEKVEEARKAMNGCKTDDVNAVMQTAYPHIKRCSKNIVNSIYLLENEAWKLKQTGDKPSPRSVVGMDDCVSTLQLLGLQLIALPKAFTKLETAVDIFAVGKSDEELQEAVDPGRLLRVDKYLTDAAIALESICETIAKELKLAFTCKLLTKITQWKNKTREALSSESSNI